MAGIGTSVFLKSHFPGFFAKFLYFSFPEAVPQNMVSLNPSIIPDVVNDLDLEKIPAGMLSHLFTLYLIAARILL